MSRSGDRESLPTRVRHLLRNKVHEIRALQMSGIQSSELLKMIASSEWYPSERWCDDYEGYCPFTSDPIGYDPLTQLPIFEGDCTWLCCLIGDDRIPDLPF